MELSLEEVGSTFTDARQRVLDFRHSRSNLFSRLQNLSVAKTLIFIDAHERIRIASAPTLFGTSFGNALFSAYVFQGGFDQIFPFNNEEDFLRDTLLQCIQIHAEAILIGLYNAFKISTSPEFQKLSRRSYTELCDCFLRNFPRIIDARDATAHYHDRAFGRYMDKQMGDQIGGGRIYDYGKILVDQSGTEFKFSFALSQFADYADQMWALVR